MTPSGSDDVGPPEDVRSTIRAQPSAATLAWAVEAIGVGARLDGLMILEGGGACAIHGLDVLDAGGGHHPLVLKRFFRGGWVEREPDVAEREARILRALEPVPLPTPALIAVDGDAAQCDFPAVLMTRLPGWPELMPDGPDDMEAWLRGIAEPLAVIHGLDSAFSGLVQDYAPYQDLETLAVPAWSSEPEAWRVLIDFSRLASRLARDREPECFIHRDYHPTNILWTHGRVSGLLDWTNASRGPAGVDRGHCRLNLVCLHGVEVAERFLTICHELSGRPALPRDPTWDVMTLIEVLPSPSVYWGWVNLGVRHLTVALVRERLDAYAALLASRI